MEHPHKRAASSAADLFVTIHQQAERVLGRTPGFYVVINDHPRELSDLAFLVINDVAQNRTLRCNSSECDAIRERRTSLNDAFAARISRDVVSSIPVPLIRDGVVLGAFGAFSFEPRDYDKRDALALVAIAELAALALENVQFNAQLEKARREADRLEEIGRAL